MRHGVSRDLVALLLDDLRKAIAYLQKNPVEHSDAGPSFSHGAIADPLTPADTPNLD